LNAKLPLLDQYGKARQDAARKYSAAFEGAQNIIAPSICDICDCHVFHQYTLRILDADRNGLMQHLLDKGIPCAIYYPIPLHSQKSICDDRYKRGFSGNQSIGKSAFLTNAHRVDDEQINSLHRVFKF
jgi:dTDP-4-amino-4,6-dideoxygalactose transaminase